MHIGILGGGPSGLFLYKRLIESGLTHLEITIFEKKDQLGSGMPYSNEGANTEHVTNVSDNEIPEIVTSIKEWISTAPADVLKRFDMVPEKFNEYKVVPRLLFGEYLSAQFDILQQRAKNAGIVTNVLLNTVVTDIIDEPEEETVKVVTENSGNHRFNAVIISTGHNWPEKNEIKTPNYFDSPYPPSKLKLKVNYPVAIRGSSLTAIDALRTLARQNGAFNKNEDGTLSYETDEDSTGFKMVMHSIDGLLPAIRFHLEDSHLSKDSVLTDEEIKESMDANGGFIPLDYIFERNFKQPIREQDPEFYEKIRDMSIEEFVTHMMSIRERLDPFVLFKAEYAEAEKSIRRRESVYWKEMLAVLSFAMNYPAKHMCAEDMMRLKKELMPLISIVIAFVPQSSCRELLALYDAGVLSLVAVDRDSKVVPQPKGGAVYHHTDEEGLSHTQHYNLFIDAIGQPPLSYSDFPFKSLLDDGNISAARLRFKSAEEGAKAKEAGGQKVDKDAAGDYYLHVPGITINDNFQVLDKYGAYSDRIYIMAVPYIGGYNPDYSGLDFCEAASERIISHLSTVSSLK
ncbi:MAG: FAD/NAD(P)-binding protein [Chitinophagaceae bacterium]